MSAKVCQPAPDFTATAVMPDGSFKTDFSLSQYRGKYIVLFFYPLDFTFVCPSEIIAHDKRAKILQEKGVEIIGVSIDSEFTHLAWRETALENGGVGSVRFPLVADIKREIISDYGVEHEDGVALRASFLIDRDGIVQHMVINNLPLGRNVDEMIRLVDALQFTEQHGEVCPAGWHKGEEGMTPSKNGVAEYLEKNAANL